MADTDWSGVPERIAELAADSGAGEVFGSAGHQWRLEPPLSAADLAEVEAQLRVTLPNEYRSFLLHVGRGGAGPAYGLFTLSRIGGRWCWEGDGAELTDLDTLDQPFSHVEAFDPADGLPEPPDEDDYACQEAFNAAEDAYWRQHDAEVERPEHSIGLLYLCHLGCAYREALVVSGPAKGQMWADDIAGDGGYRPLHDVDGTPLRFDRWYRRWLDESTAEVSRARAQ